MGKAAHAGDVAALLIGRHAQQDGEVVHRLAYHHVEEFHRRNLRVISKQSLRAVLRTLIKMYTFAPNFKFGTK